MRRNHKPFSPIPSSQPQATQLRRENLTVVRNTPLFLKSHTSSEAFPKEGHRGGKAQENAGVYSQPTAEVTRDQLMTGAFSAALEV